MKFENIDLVDALRRIMDIHTPVSYTHLTLPTT